MKTEEKIKLYERSIQELRRMHDELCEGYKNAKTKTLTFLGGGLAFLGYFYSDGDLFIPKETYGIIIYFLALFLYLSALFLLFLTTQPVIWTMPTDIKAHKKLEFQSYLEFLAYCKEEYASALAGNLSHHEKKQKNLNLALSFLMAGGILLLVIKNFK